MFQKKRIYLMGHLRLNLCKAGIARDAPEYLRTSPSYAAKTVFFSVQPAMAWIGLIGSVLIIVFACASWWDGRFTAAKLGVGYGEVSYTYHGRNTYF
jgi:hypothetical protein